MTEDASTESDENSGFLSVKARWIALAVLIVATIGGALGYWQYRVYYPSTDNAYVKSDIVRVASTVNGEVQKVYVSTDDRVEADDPLFDLDPSLYEAALRAAQAQFDAAAEASGTAADDLKAAAKDLNEKRMALDAALDDYQSSKTSGGAGDKRKSFQDALAAYRKAETAFADAQDAGMEITTPTVKLRAAAAQLQKAVYDRVSTHVLAPSAGFVSSVDLLPGATVQMGRPVFAIIEADRWWVDANFKETDLSRIRAGQPADIVLDMYPGVSFKGTVESISAGSGATFSVLPPENATGNWVKVTQRFPVRIKFDDPEADPSHPLRVGASAEVTVDTTSDDTSASETPTGTE